MDDYIKTRSPSTPGVDDGNPRPCEVRYVARGDGETVRAYLNGALELETRTPAVFPIGLDQHFFGGRSDNADNWEGRLDEIAVFERALSSDEITRLGVK